MKEEYSKINFPYMRKIKKQYIEDNKLFDNALKNIMLDYKEKKIVIEETLGYINDVKFYQTFIENKIYKNYYIESKELSDFFCNTAIKKEIILNFSKIINKNIEIFSSFENGKGGFLKEKNLSGIIYSRSFPRSLFFMFYASEFDNYKKVFSYVTDGDTICTVPIFSSDSKILQEMNNPIYNNSLRLVLNMIFYMDAFPDKISNKPPEEVCDKLNFNNSKTISISKDIEDYLHENREVSPHLRRGHFKYLGSDYFKNKKGQTIFVKSSFVKGKAVTIKE